MHLLRLARRFPIIAYYGRSSHLSAKAWKIADELETTKNNTQVQLSRSWLLPIIMKSNGSQVLLKSQAMPPPHQCCHIPAADRTQTSLPGLAILLRLRTSRSTDTVGDMRPASTIFFTILPEILGFWYQQQLLPYLEIQPCFRFSWS